MLKIYSISVNAIINMYFFKSGVCSAEIEIAFGKQSEWLIKN